MANLLAEVRAASAVLDQRDGATRSRIASLEATVNDLMRRAGRPSGDARGKFWPRSLRAEPARDAGGIFGRSFVL
jgi:hypothetical protein